jgi:GTP-binding protein EngB required for normal cell division
MPELNFENQPPRRPGELNEPQQRRLLITCKYIDKLLGDIESALDSAASFPRYVPDLSPAHARVIEDHIRRFRSQLLRVLDWQQLKPEPAEVPVTRSISTDLAFIDIAIEELRPSYMRGCGEVPGDVADELNGVVHELRALAGSMDRYLRQDLGANLEARLLKLEDTGYDVALLRLIERIVADHGMVEFRARIDSLASRMEDNNLEVAFFGRVSSGKSSLLNALLSTDALPVGINPITAVPTKLRYGPRLCAAVAYGDGREETVTVEQLAGLVTEQGNPGNLRNVARAVVEVPSPRLKQGIVLVDTPGLGSLARRGAAETLAYLPSCDLALVLIDAGTALNEEDIGTLRLLYEGGIPAIVLVSKADLLAEGDLHRVTGYIHEQLQTELGIEMDVHPVSSLANYSILLDHFFERELLPRFDQARSLRNRSIARKIGALRGSVTAALEATLDQTKRRGQGLPSQVHDLPLQVHELEEQLRLVTGAAGEQRSILSRAFFQLGETPEAILNETAERALAWMRANSQTRVAPLQLAEWLHEAVWKSVDCCVESACGASRDAIEKLQAVAREMGRADMPAQEEVESLLRDMPRFELASLPEAIHNRAWMFLGSGVARSGIKNKLRESIGALLKQELHAYGRALTQWSNQFVTKTVLLIGSYADAYRVQLHRIAGIHGEAVDAPRMADDLSLLKNWNPARNRDEGEAIEREA